MFSTPVKSTLAWVALVAVACPVLSCGSEVRKSLPCRGNPIIAASGSSAQAGAMNLFNIAYSEACKGRSVDYISNGSGAGRSDFISGDADFGGSDSPLGLTSGETDRARARCGGKDAWNLPLVFGAIAIIFNVAELDSLVLDAPTAAKIFNGSVTQWDAPEIAALNPGQPLPSSPIVVIARNDESGTTENFQNYLATAAGSAWGRGSGETFHGVAGETAKGNEGAWEAMRHLSGSITYTAWPFAKQNGLPTASILTSAASAPVRLSVDSVAKSIASVDITTSGNNLVLDTSALVTPTKAGAYPIVMATYETVCSTYPDPEVGAAVKSFLTVALGEGQRDLGDAGYVPVPDSVRDRLVEAINAIT